MKGKELVKILEKNGWTVRRIVKEVLINSSFCHSEISLVLTVAIYSKIFAKHSNIRKIMLIFHHIIVDCHDR